MFGIDGSFFHWGTKLFDVIVISIISILISLISFTLLTGASIAAFFYTMDKVVIHERGYLLKNYLKAFKDNIKKATILWILQLFGYSFVAINIYQLNRTGLGGIVLVASYFVLIEMIIITCYGYIMLAKIEMPLKEIITKSLLYGHKHLLTTLSIVSVVALFAILVLKVHPIFIIIGCGIGGYIISRLVLEMVLPNYIDKDKLVGFSKE